MRGAVRCGTAILLVAVPAWLAYAEEPVEDARLNELTAEYTLLYQTGAHARAIPVVEQALAEAEATFGPDDERVAQTLNDLGRLHELLNQMEPAARAHERALRIRDRVFSGNGPAVVQSLNNLARVYAAQARRADAKPLYERALAITERHVPPESPALLYALESYAAVLRDGGELDAAARIESRIDTIRSARGEPAAAKKEER